MNLTGCGWTLTTENSLFSPQDTERHSRNQTQYPISNTEYPISNITADFQYPISRPTKRYPAGRENIQQKKWKIFLKEQENDG